MTALGRGEGEASSSGKSASSSRVLLAESETIVSLMEARALRAMGCEVDRVPSGEDALSLLGRGLRYDLAIVDADLDGRYDGEESSRLIAEQGRVPVIVRSSRSRDEIGSRLRDGDTRVFVECGAGVEAIVRAAELVLESSRAEALLAALLRSTERIGRLEWRMGGSGSRLGSWRYAGGPEVSLSAGAMRLLGFDTARVPARAMLSRILDPDVVELESFIAYDKGERAFVGILGKG